MKKLNFILLMLMTGFGFAQTAITSESLAKRWVIDSATFPANIVKLRVYNNAIDSNKMYNSFDFKKDGEMTFKLNIPKGVGMCGNGFPIVKSASWSYMDGSVRIKMVGGYLAAGTYDFDVLYKIVSLKDGKLILHKTATYKNEHSDQ